MAIFCCGLLAGCGESEFAPYTDGPGVEPVNPFLEAKVGQEETFEILTWNIETFAKNGSVTVEYVVQAIEALDPDVIALQEISSVTRFDELVAALDGWSGYRANSSYADINLAYVWKEAALSDVTVREVYSIGDHHPLPRTPLVLECEFNNIPLVIINNHLKAMSGQDNEDRRRLGSECLDTYIADSRGDERVILVGDLNDLLSDSEADNVFQVFLDAPDQYRFVDMEIAQGGSVNWSFPGWPSHLDHILITNELFADFSNEGSEVSTLRLDRYLTNGFSTYDQEISDHRPVYMKLNFVTP